MHFKPVHGFQPANADTSILIWTLNRRYLPANEEHVQWNKSLLVLLYYLKQYCCIWRWVSQESGYRLKLCSVEVSHKLGRPFALYSIYWTQTKMRLPPFFVSHSTITFQHMGNGVWFVIQLNYDVALRAICKYDFIKKTTWVRIFRYVIKEWKVYILSNIRYINF